MQSTLDLIENLVTTALEEMSEELAARCGTVANLGKETTGISSTPVNGALTELDGRVQDHVTKALLAADLNLGFLFEEDTELLRGHAGDTGELAAIFDPIDGTISYIKGQHDYCSMFGVSHRGRIVMGILAFYHPFRIFVGRVDRAVTATTATVSRSGSPLRIVCHYRLFHEPYGATRQALEDAGCIVIPMPLDLEGPGQGSFAWAMDKGVGSNGAAIMAVLEGHWDAYLAPHVSLHDFAGPWGVAEARGAACVKFDTIGDGRSNNWNVDPDAAFLVPTRGDYPKRYRLMIARDQDVAGRVRDILGAVQG
jgi:fructose-1,6-bisphosphatase/inositol monophosphatase family enzyme